MTMTFSDQAECCHGVCKPKSTAVFDNEDAGIAFEQVFATQQEAEQVLAQLVAKAREVESEACQIESAINPVEDGFLMQARFNFCCQAETMIFQLSLR